MRKSKVTNKIVRILLTAICMVLTPGHDLFSKETIEVCGTGDSQELLRVLANTYEKKHPGSKINVPDSIGSSGGIRATANGKCDLGRVARPIKEKEKKYGLNYHLFAKSPVVFAVNPGVKRVENLTTAQIIGIYSGAITSWSEVDGEDIKILVANREPGDSSRSILMKNIPGFKEIEHLTGETIYTTPEAVSILSEHNKTIGYLPLSAVMSTDLIVLKVDGISLSTDNVHKGLNKLVSHFGFVWKSKLKEPTK